MKKLIFAIILCSALLCSCGDDPGISKEQSDDSAALSSSSSKEVSSADEKESSVADSSDEQSVLDISDISDEDNQKCIDAFNKFTPGEEDPEETERLIEEGTAKERYTIVHLDHDKEQKHSTHSVLLANYGENIMKYIEDNYDPLYFKGWDFEKGESVEEGEKPDIRKETNDSSFRRFSIYTEWSGVSFDDYNELAKHPKCFKLTMERFADGTNSVRLSDRIEGTVNIDDSYYTLSDDDYDLLADAIAGLYLSCDE